ncbi:hypothetical protein LPJ66_009208 [Kickxella alabastrina]|uniref:Uncharacterized protein n=1 Tax=Kickxella alabastrina TaxID=61397 RepID=A0ACC1I4L0_9FUNG|nr:hypothetical protein LPJ66_009208 [Kickxella alabastrina]
MLTSSNTTALYGHFSALIVGRRYYSSNAAIGETVGLVREPHNQHDSNAIAVCSHDGGKLGHLPRWLASVLAPCMDRSGCTLFGVVSGMGSAYATPVEVNIFARPDAAALMYDMLGNYWHMWQLEAPAADQENNDVDSIFDDLDDMFVDNSAGSLIRSPDADADSKLFDVVDSDNTSNPVARVLVVSTASGIGDWVSYIKHMDADIKWAIYTRGGAVTAGTIAQFQAVFVQHKDATHLLDQTRSVHWATIAIDQTAIDDEVATIAPEFGALLSLRAPTVLYI